MKLPKIDYLKRVDASREKDLADLEERIGHEFKDKELLNRALSHKSYTNERGYGHNEQSEKLEFLGDGVLGLILNETLFRRFSDHEEGYLARIKSAVGSEPVLAEIAEELELGRFVLLGRGEESAGGRSRPALLADTLEAVIGALYIDGGFPAARKFVKRRIARLIDAVASGRAHKDHKSLFQEWVQKEKRTRPVYKVIKSKGPEHSKEFQVGVYVGDEKIAVGRGRSKKDAEQDAAEKAYARLVEGTRRGSERRRAGSLRREGRRRDDRGERARDSGKEEKTAQPPGETAQPPGGAAQPPGGKERRTRRRGRRNRGRKQEVAGAARRAPPPRPLEEEELLPPPDVEDIVAWAVEESRKERARNAV